MSAGEFSVVVGSVVCGAESEEEEQPANARVPSSRPVTQVRGSLILYTVVAVQPEARSSVYQRRHYRSPGIPKLRLRCPVCRTQAQTLWLVVWKVTCATGLGARDEFIAEYDTTGRLVRFYNTPESYDRYNLAIMYGPTEDIREPDTTWWQANQPLVRKRLAELAARLYGDQASSDTAQ